MTPPSVCDVVCIQMFADDMVIYMDGKVPEQVAAKLLVSVDTQWDGSLLSAHLSQSGQT